MTLRTYVAVTYVAVAFVVFCLSGEARAVPLRVERVIQLPGGKPAVRAKVLLHSLNTKDGSLKQEKRVVGSGH